MKEFRLPDPGEGLVEAEIVTWRVAVGDEVKVNDIVVEVETSKSLVELPIPYAGTVSQLLHEEGETVDVGSPIIVIDDGTGPAVEPAADEPAVESGGATAAPERVANLVGYGPRATEARRRPRAGSAGTSGEAAGPVRDDVATSFGQAQPVSRPTDLPQSLSRAQADPSGERLPDPGPPAKEPGIASGPVLAKPPVRKLAKDLGVDLGQVIGSGDGGTITRDDVARAADRSDRAGAAAARPVTVGEQDHRVPVKGIRKHMAQAMVASAFSAPHVTEWVTVDVTATMELIDRLKARRDFRDVRVTPTLIAAKAVGLALREHPDLHAVFDEPAQEIVYRGRLNLGIAVATDRGLMVPNITDAGRLSLHELAEQLDELVDTARSGRTPPAAMTGGTFTITNVGVFGIDSGTPIINPGECGILALGAIARRPWVVGTGAEERIEPRWVTTLAVSFDHRVADGASGSAFLATVAELLADPGLALLR
ncbi:dihydrolipoamide acetyltransferase family protein [Microlunatus sp. Y2014]|uniref:dihydrolipoamide acetyltransferase family protein n=1 Tax=Microlunatus sp. Y2014 TaxID=3418488 RepID=UPI003DA6D08B